MLSALAAEGKDFDRDELNAMLDKLAASPEPKVRRGPAAMCYSVAIPRPVYIFVHSIVPCLFFVPLGRHPTTPPTR